MGAVKLDVPRDPHFYRKELDLRLSCSYGPGRYDVQYEENGIDYPYAYVRWTEQRNMEAFLQLLSQGSINIKPLITHTFDISEAGTAYDIVTGKVQEPHIGILLHYPDNDSSSCLQRSYSTAQPYNILKPGLSVQGALPKATLFLMSKILEQD